MAEYLWRDISKKKTKVNINFFSGGMENVSAYFCPRGLSSQEIKEGVRAQNYTYTSSVL